MSLLYLLQALHPTTLFQSLLNFLKGIVEVAETNGLKTGFSKLFGGMRARLLTEDADCLKLQVFRDLDTFVFDCDGVLYHNYTPIEGSREFLARLTALGKTCLFITNASGLSRKGMAAKLSALGFGEVDEERCISAGSAAADYLRLNHPEVRSAYVCGKPGLLEELKLAGIECYGEDDKGGLQALLAQKFNDEGVDKVGAVVVGHLDDGLCYERLAKAAVYAQNQDRPFIGTNLDQSWFFDMGALEETQSSDASKSLKEGKESLSAHKEVQNKRITAYYPAGGACVRYISYVAERDPDIICGKPSIDLGKLVIQKYGLNPSRTLMIGDRLNTDIEFGIKAGFKTLLVLSGCHGMDEVTNADYAKKPDFIAERLGAIVALL